MRLTTAPLNWGKAFWKDVFIGKWAPGRLDILEMGVFAGKTTNHHLENGGAEGIRTPDPHNAIVVLYQLSYDPDRAEHNLMRSAGMSKLFGCDVLDFFCVSQAGSGVKVSG